ncbi:MAG: DUF445 family protein [Candidatus Sericytochromatia bacterium]
MNWTLLIINLIAGALVGYVTKTLAINMLFRKYPIVGGAKIIEDREQLEVAMSELVEERLIRPDTLLEEFQKAAFQERFEALIHAIVQQTLQTNLRHLDTLAELKGFSATLRHLRGFLLRESDAILQPAEQVLLEHIRVDDVLSPEQLQHVLRQSLLVVGGTLYTHREAIWSALEQDWAGLSRETLLSDALVQQGLANLFSPELGPRLVAEGAGPLSAALDQVLERLQVDALLDQLDAQLKQRTLAELLGPHFQTDALQTLIERLRLLLHTPAGQELLGDLLDHLLEVLKGLDLPLGSLLITAELETSLLQFVRRHLPQLIEQLEGWLARNRDEISQLLQGAIETHLASEGLIKQLLGTIFMQQLTERYQLVETTLRELKELSHQSEPHLLSLLHRLLENTRISDVAALVERYIWDREALHTTVRALIDIYFPRLHLRAADALLEIRLGEIPGMEDLSLRVLFRQRLLPALKNSLATQLKEDPQALLGLQQGLLQVWQSLRPQLVGVRAGWLQRLQPLWLEALTRPFFQEGLARRLSAQMRAVLGGRNLYQLLNAPLLADLHTRLKGLYQQRLDDFLQQLRQEKISTLYGLSTEIYRELCQNQRFPRQLAQTLVNLMVRLIGTHRLLDGKIFVAVKESFGRFSNDELKDEMESFMGEELQPIKLLGAILGAAVGAGMWGLSLLPGYATYVTGYWALFTYSAAYALSEVGTNWLAIRMLFRPYSPRRFLGLTLPFTPGIFPKNKAALAESMVNFVDKKLLAKDNMVRILEKYHPQWKTVIKQVVAHDDYAVIHETVVRYTQEHYDTLVPDLLRMGFEAIHRQRQELTRSLVQEIRAFRASGADARQLEAELARRLGDARGPVLAALMQGFYRLRQDDTPLQQQLSPELLSECQAALATLCEEGLQTAQRHLADGEWPQGWRALLHQGLSQLLAQPPGRLLPTGLLGALQTPLLDWLERQLQNPRWHQALLNLFETHLFSRGLSSQRSLGQLWEGRLLGVAQRESDVLIRLLCDYGLRLAHNQKSRLVALVLHEIEKKGPVEAMMVLLGGVDRDVRGVVDVIVDQRLPDYLMRKQPELRELWLHYLHTYLAPVQLAELGLHEQVFDQARIRALLEERVLRQPRFLALLRQLAGQSLDAILAHLSVADLLAMLDVNGPEALLARFSPEIELLREHVAIHLAAESEALSALAQSEMRLLVRLLLGERSLRHLLAEVPAPALEAQLQLAWEALSQSQIARLLQPLLLKDALAQIGPHPAEWLDQALLERDLHDLLDALTRPSHPDDRSRHFQRDVQHLLRPVLLNFVAVLNSNIEQETKQAIEDILVNSLVDSLRINNREIMEPIAFDTIIRREVQQMEPARIEAMFDFAQPIFRLLVWYGALGGIVGLAVALFEVLLH